MALKDILVHVNETLHCSNRVDYAIGLAKQHGATLIAVYAQSDPKVPRFAEQDTYTTGINANIDARREVFIEGFEKAKETYGAKAEEAGVEVQWHRGKFTSSRELVTDQMLNHSQQADLVIVSQHDAENSIGRTPADLPERLVLESGRPVLVLPFAGVYNPVVAHAVVAWDNGKQSVRAVNDAIALMQSAKNVKVIEINPKQKKKQRFRVSSVELAEHLGRHGIAAEADHVASEDINEAEVLLNAVSDTSADLLVMGAYGHSRYRELILGGVTQHIFEHMTAPVLMSH